MNILIIPGFTGYPEEKTFEALEEKLVKEGHKVIKLAWPHFPDELDKYNVTETIKSAQGVLRKLDNNKTIILGFSMGGIIACYLAEEFKPIKLGLIVTPYQAGSNEDLSGKYKDWEEKGYRDLTSSKYGDLRIPFSFIKDSRKYNALTIIKDIHCPILFIVGEKDTNVPIHVTRQLYQKANNPKMWFEIKDMEHKYQYQPDMLLQVNKHLLKFITNDY